MSETKDVIVIGGGVVGLSIARSLAQAGMKVSLFDKQQVGAEASWAGAGLIAPCNPHRDDPMYHFQNESIRMYPEFCRAVHDESGIDPEYENYGEIQLAFEKQFYNGLIANAKAAVEAGETTPEGKPGYEMLTTEQILELEPECNPKIMGGMINRMITIVRNPRLLQGLKESCIKAGVTIHEHNPVMSLKIENGSDSNADKKVTGVVTESCDTFHADKIVLAAGAWSSIINEELHELMPVHPIRGQIMLLQCEKRLFKHAIALGKRYIVGRKDGHVVVGSTEEPKAGYEKRNTPFAMAALSEFAIKLVPALRDSHVANQWAGLRPGSIDKFPYLGNVPGFDGLVAATGHGRSGLTNAPGTAELITCLLTEKAHPLLDDSEKFKLFLPGRVANGS